MISVELSEKVLSISHSNKVFNFTDESGQIIIDNIIDFMNETSIELLKDKIAYKPLDNIQMENGLKLFITTLFSKLCEEKASTEEDTPVSS